MGWSPLVDMEMDDEDKMDLAVPEISKQPDYPWGLRISLTEKELKKLGLEADCEVGDLLDMRCFAVVTSVSSHQADGKTCARVELQIEKISVENEMTESEDD